MNITTSHFKGVSMSPFLKDGDEIVIDTSDCTPSPGEILFIKDLNQDEFIAHRVLSKSPLLMKGDRSPYYDEYSSQEDIEIFGKVIGKKVKDKYLIWDQSKSYYKNRFIGLSHLTTYSFIIRYPAILALSARASPQR